MQATGFTVRALEKTTPPMKHAALALSVCAALCGSAQSAGLLMESFGYPDGNVVGSTAATGTWAAHSGAASVPVQVTSTAIVLNQGSGSREDVYVPLGTTITTGQTFYASFDVTVSGGSNTVYFAHFKDGGSGTAFNSRIFITASPGGDFTFGIGDVGASATATFSTGFSFNTTYKLVVAYHYDSGVSDLWVNPVTESSEKITSTDADPSQVMSAFAFRQAAGNSVQVIDSLMVGTSFNDVVPEPSCVLLGAFGFLGLIRRRR
jgi:hypothetical protein